VFGKILIANRGEIACRVIKTARRMGIATVAVYSEADRDGLHVEMADEAVPIGPAPAAQSYLRIEAVVEACRRTGAEAVHPGYGFLSENARFAEALAAAGIVFIGPPPAAIEAMGDKIQSKRVAAAAGVTTVPGHVGEIADDAQAARIAQEIGYPVMIKASAGGGGKGMRVAYGPKELREGFARARSEARSSFGDERVFIEKFVEEPRHIEIQVLADRHGAVLHLGERECSIQRRNQKVVEEAPSPFLDAATRQAMGREAVALARAVGYESAGTVEFIVDRARNFYFLEMNTRLQVEHPVTELVTGLDLVEQMIRVAAGEPLGFTQDEVRLNGWAVETRVYAEDPARSFLPSTGRLVRYRPPAETVREGVTVRNDTGVYEGAEISLHYDPLVAKLVTHGPTRSAAVDAQADALDAFAIEGIQHNIPFLSALMAHPRWREGRLSTGFIADEFPDGFQVSEPAGAAARLLAAVAAAVDHRSNARRRGISGQLGGRPYRFARRRIVHLGAQRFRVEVEADQGGEAVRFFGEDGAEETTVVLRSDWRPGQPVWAGAADGRRVWVQVRPLLNGVALAHRGSAAKAYVYTEREAELALLMPERRAADTSRLVLCPMPGVVRSIEVREGQEVKTGEALCVVEAMKMENVLRAERDGTVAKVHAKTGDSLAVDAVILEFA